MKYSKNCCLLLALILSLNGFSQDVSKGMEMLELVKISETYRLARDMSFDMHYTYADSARPKTILEEMYGKYKIHNRKYWSMIDSIELVQGNQYSLGIYYNDSLIMVNRKQDYSNVMQVPMMDSLFREAHVSDIRVNQLNDSTRTLKIRFNDQSPYRAYEMQYDLNNFLIRKLKYYITATTDDEKSITSGVECIAISFSNYSDEVVSDDYFNETKFIDLRGDQLVTQPAFAGFKLIAPANNQVQ